MPSVLQGWGSPKGRGDAYAITPDWRAVEKESESPSKSHKTRKEETDSGRAAQEVIFHEKQTTHKENPDEQEPEMPFL